MKIAAQKFDPYLFDICSYCSGPAETWDHVRPIANGGADHPHNMVRACLRCNQEKGNKELLEFLLDRASAHDLAHAA